MCKLSIALGFIVFPPVVYILLARIYEWMVGLHFVKAMMGNFIPDMQMINAMPTLLTFVATLAYAAYFVRSHYNFITRRAFLFKVNKQWTNLEMRAAREIIQRLYLECVAEKVDHDKIGEHIGKKIVAMWSDKNKVGEFMTLANFLDYLESLGYMVEKRYICPFELNNVTGHTIANYAKVFAPYIEHVRAKGDSFACYFKNFDMLICRLNCKKCCKGAKFCMCKSQCKCGQNPCSCKGGACKTK